MGDARSWFWIVWCAIEGCVVDCIIEMEGRGE